MAHHGLNLSANPTDTAIESRRAACAGAMSARARALLYLKRLRSTACRRRAAFYAFLASSDAAAARTQAHRLARVRDVYHRCQP